MTTTITRNLGREVAEKVGWMVDCVRYDNSSITMMVWNPNREMIYKRRHILSAGLETPDIDQAWIWALDDNIPDYPNDLNACARDLAREGYRVVLRQTVNGWEVYFVPVYTDGQLTVYGSRIEETEREDNNPAVAWCESFLALCAYVEAKGTP